MKLSIINKKRNGLIIVLALALILGWFIVKLFFIDKSEGVKETERRTISVMTTSNYPPFEFVNENGKPDGFDNDLIQAIAQDVNLELEYESGLWLDIRKALEDGCVHALTGMNNSIEREKLVDFTNPILINSHALFVRKGSSIKSLNDIRGKDVIIQKGDIAYEKIINEGWDVNVILTYSSDEFVRRLSAGEGDCGIHTRYVITYHINKNKIDNLEVVGPAIWQNIYCFPVKEGDSALVNRLNRGLEIVKENGRYDEIYGKWFGVATEWQNERWQIIRWIIFAAILLIIFFFVINLFWNYELRRRIKERTQTLRMQIRQRKETEDKLKEKENALRERNESLTHLNEEIEKTNESLEKVNDSFNEAKEKAEANNLLKSTFLANLSHEIRTPISGIVSFAELLQYGHPEPQEREEGLEIILKSGHQLLHLIDEVLEVSKIESGEQEIKKELFSVGRMFNELLQFFQPMASEKNLELIVKGDSLNSGIFIHSDKKRIIQIMNNLLTNAIKYSEQGTIEMGCKLVDQSLEFYVKDDGIGIASDQQKNIFMPYWQIKADRSRKSYKGTGIGLAICKGLVELLGGSISLCSQTGKGSCFSFDIPLSHK